MNFNKCLLYIFALVFFAACSTDNANKDVPTVSVRTDTTSVTNTTSVGTSDSLDDFTSTDTLAAPNATTPEQPNCLVKGEVLENNQKWIPERRRLVAVVADKRTEDPDYGPSHRLLRVYHSDSCKLVFEKELPVNLSPDFPYYLAGIDSLNSHLISIMGSGMFYIYDLENDILSKQLKPTFKGQRYFDDAQSGRIMQMRTLGRYAIGYAQGTGAFVYNLTIPKTPKQEQPLAEYMINENDFASLFVLKADQGKEYTILPTYQADNNDFSLNLLTDEPSEISRQMTKSAQDNRFIILRQGKEREKAIAIDMKTKQRIDLPKEIAQKNTQEVLDWVRVNHLK
ncbi:MAG: hypothetical protein AAF738_05460 [Bacteroidota bacterium]